MSVNSKMTTIADKTRELVGSTEKMGLDAIASNLETTVGEVDAQNSLIQQIKTGLAEAEENIGRANNEISDQSVLIQQIEAALEGKTAGGTQLPTLKNPGTAEDLAKGKELIDADGNVVVGSIPVESAEFFDNYSDIYFDDGLLSPCYRLQEPVLLRKGTEVYVDVPASDYGDLKPEEAPKGKTFTSASGFCIVGTAEGLILAENERIYQIAKAESSFELNTLNFESSAVGTLE
jgi:hypothetical protein